MEEFDVQLSKRLNQQAIDNNQFIEFVTELLQNCLLAVNPITSIEEHVLVIHALKKSASSK